MSVRDGHRGTPGGPSHDWSVYYRETRHRPLRSTLRFALMRFAAEWRDRQRPYPRTAVDLGCGDGRESIALLRQGWQVLAVDAEPAAIEAVQNAAAENGDGRLQTSISRFESAELPPAVLINSSFSLPLCPPGAFHRLWDRMISSLLPGGRFCGQLFGDRDSWSDPTSGKSGITFLRRADVGDLLGALEVEQFLEEETVGTSPGGRTKRWHIYHIVGRKP